MARDRAAQLAVERVRVALVVEPHVVDAHAARAELLREVAHRREDEHELLHVVAHGAPLGLDLDEQHDVARRIEVA